MSETVILACPQCGAKNRLPTSKLNNKPKCGNCHKSLGVGEASELNNKSLSKFISNNEPLVVIDFWAARCQPCLMMAPNFYHAAKKLPTVRFAKIQTDRHEQAGAEFGIRSLPMLVALKNGHEMDRLSGLRTASDIMHWVKSLS
ncbi:thioredoxin domain-containing protein [Marinicella gelatinilytica]|uniref:thioredoxin domain-containing protein n=1 Tax=Marinicella gelatinilytica TaxID=2996017 RepID=UPI002260E633|nr:thioredoxin domain-containing protein [Marinicella gelatinilytica]MCX7544879.1 thioredoxin domain-containing protein [Marinicella gelatinilytica]